MREKSTVYIPSAARSRGEKLRRSAVFIGREGDFYQLSRNQTGND
jgi:hypothetical protein